MTQKEQNVKIIKVRSGEMLTLKDRFFSYLAEIQPYENPDEPYTFEEAWQNMLYPDIKKCWIVCDGKIAGFVFYYFEDKALEPSMWYISQFYIFPSYRGQHVGRSAVEQLKTFMDKVFFLVLDQNPAEKFWKKCFSDYQEFLHPQVVSKNYERYICYRR